MVAKRETLFALPQIGLFLFLSPEGGAVEWSLWLEIIKQYGPIVGLFLGLIFWQTRWINRLLRENRDAYLGEISRMHEREKMLLARLLGPQPSSLEQPRISEVMAEVEQRTIEGRTEPDDDGEGDSKP